jgi:hypothetical protein
MTQNSRRAHKRHGAMVCLGELKRHLLLRLRGGSQLALWANRVRSREALGFQSGERLPTQDSHVHLARLQLDPVADPAGAFAGDKAAP